MPVIGSSVYFGGIVAGALSLVIIIILGRYVYLSAFRVLLKWYRCREPGQGELSTIDPIIDDLSSNFSVKRPKIYIFESSVPVIFTVGSHKGPCMVLSSRSLSILDKNELKCIIAREMVRIKEGSISQNTFVALVAGIIASFSTTALWMAMLSGFGNEEDPAPKFIRFVVMGIVMFPCSIIVYTGASDLTLKADTEVARVLGKKDVLVSALKRMHTDILLNSMEYFNPGHVHLFTMNPVKVNSFFDLHLSLFEMRPDMAQRLNAISQVMVNGSEF